MPKFLKPDDIMDAIGVCRVTALRMMWQMNPIIVSQGKQRQRIVVTEEDFLKFMQDRALRKKSIASDRHNAGSNKKLQRR